MTKQVIKAGTKYGDMLYSADTDEEFETSALKLLKWNLEEFQMYWDEDEEKARAILKEGDGNKAWRFLEDRREGEYEWVELETVK